MAGYLVGRIHKLDVFLADDEVGRGIYLHAHEYGLVAQLLQRLHLVHIAQFLRNETVELILVARHKDVFQRHHLARLGIDVLDDSERTAVGTAAVGIYGGRVEVIGIIGAGDGRVHQIFAVIPCPPGLVCLVEFGIVVLVLFDIMGGEAVHRLLHRH